MSKTNCRHVYATPGKANTNLSHTFRQAALAFSRTDIQQEPNIPVRLRFAPPRAAKQPANLIRVFSRGKGSFRFSFPLPLWENASELTETAAVS
jgi:hypothetical protein